ncbi:hypothetical protein G9F72_002115 [Clostridium estertheticum]|nr:hypothetical protein [Clostridium estertheticum]
MIRIGTSDIKNEVFVCRKSILVLQHILGDRDQISITAIKIFMEGYLCNGKVIFHCINRLATFVY